MKTSKSIVSKGKLSKLKISLASTLLMFGLVASPAQADHYRHVIAPLATVAALAYLFDHSHHRSHRSTYKRKTYHGYSQHNYGHQNGHQQHNRRKHSHSSGGYSHKSKRH